MAKMWAGRTGGITEKLADDFNSSIRFDCKMTTNGTLLDEAFLERAREAEMVIGLSFDGKAQDVCRRYADKNKSPTSAVVEKNAKMLLKYIPNSVAMMTFAASSLRSKPRLLKYFTP